MPTRSKGRRTKRPARRTLEKRPIPAKPRRNPRTNLGRKPVRKTRTTKRPTRRLR